MILNGIKKSALLLMSLGSDQSAEILKHLTTFEIRELTNYIANMQQFSKKTLDQVLLECYDALQKNDAFNFNSDKYLSNMLIKALGEDYGNTLSKHALEMREAQLYIDCLNKIDPKKVAILLENEHLQVVTTILIHLDMNQAATVLSYFDDKKRAEIIFRITEFNGIEKSSLAELKNVIDNLLNNDTLTSSDKGGIKVATKILNFMKIKCEKKTIKTLSTFNRELAKKIIQERFEFTNLVHLNDKYIKLLLQHIEKEKLFIALKNTSVDVQNKFIKNMSQHEIDELRKNFQKTSYISNEAIKNEQKLILIMIRSIIENGNVLLKNLREYYV
ncbi:MAG: flagellar motor switch protein FliG [Buchnera aphidicola (Pentalonia nigronervosa)]|uniref:Flagellar motor switch protein FliG n=1 Tax=Buchnera aphidicola (Pentalonia nigronervosa) TaxID=1309793 RepID=A0A7H1AZB2_9GAMM|nr:MAG: flagellar motor switch protein FliG [Buchnera aphidicola (Pentalonia nigronervosa)]